jgi:hypothetical protein
MKLEEAISRYPNFLKLGEDGVLEMYLDNHMLSTYRKCPMLFVEQHLNNLSPKGIAGRNWSLEFGMFVHKCLEYFYQAQRDSWKHFWIHPAYKTFEEQEMSPKLVQNIQNFLIICANLWTDYQLDDFRETKGYKSLGGWQGALKLMTEYYQVHAEKERMRFVGWELNFGRKKEVPIGKITKRNEIDYGEIDVICRFYYCGRIDMIIDDGSKIGPLDHKTCSHFDGNESSDFKPHDGMQGYVYAVQKILGDKLAAQGITCNDIIINHISVKPCERAHERFKRSYKTYTASEMEEWRQRQVTTFKQIYNIIINDEQPFWNTDKCSYFIFSLPCPFKILHETPPSTRENIRKLMFQERKPWNPEEVDK